MPRPLFGGRARIRSSRPRARHRAGRAPPSTKPRGHERWDEGGVRQRCIRGPAEGCRGRAREQDRAHDMPMSPSTSSPQRRAMATNVCRHATDIQSHVPSESEAHGLDPDDLETTLRVLAQLDTMDDDHPHFVAVRRATAKMFKAAKQARRSSPRTRSPPPTARSSPPPPPAPPDRIDDETRGHPARDAPPTAPTAGTLIKPRACYICKQHYTEVDAFYHQLCPDCAALNHAKRDARTDLTGRRALLTGGRAKIGMYIALRLLRDGAHTTITTRFPRDAVRRFAAMPDTGDWLHRLRVVGIDLRDPAQVVALADSVAEAGPARHPDQQRRPDRAPLPRRYAPLVDAESRPAARRPAARAGHLRAHERRASARARARRCRPAHRWPPRAVAAAEDADDAHGRRRSRPARPRSSAWPPAPPSTPAAWCPTSTTPTAGCRPCTRSTRSSCSRCSCAT